MSPRQELRRGVALVAALCWPAVQGEARPLPKASPAPKVETCPGMGEGFVRVEGSDTCVQMSGSVRVELMHQSGGSSLDPDGR